MADPHRPTPRWRAGLRAAGMVAAVALLVLPAAADWLVTADGGRVETSGPWEVKGRLVVFTTADGTLSSMRADQVDLAASERATRLAEEAAAAPAEAEEPATEVAPEPARRRITTSDVGRAAYQPPLEVSEDGEEAADGEVAATPDVATQLVVLSSQEEETLDGHVRISGSLSNNGETTVVAAGLTLFLQDVDGEVAARGDAVLSSSALAPGRVVSFTADFPDIFAYSSVAFRASGTRMATAADGAAEGADSDLYAPLPGEDDLYAPDGP